MQVDYIDLYQVHWPDPKTPISETADALSELLTQGKIRAIGASNYSTSQMELFQKTAPLNADQPPYNLFEREAEETILPYCQKHHLATLGYGALCRGLLSGKMRPDTQFQGDDLRKVDPKFQPPRFSQYLECVQRLDAWSQKNYQRPVLALAVRWVLDKDVSVALWGARKPQQLEAIDSVWGWKLKPQDFEAIDNILEETIRDPVGPEFMAPPAR